MSCPLLPLEATSDRSVHAAPCSKVKVALCAWYFGSAAILKPHVFKSQWPVKENPKKMKPSWVRLPNLAWPKRASEHLHVSNFTLTNFGTGWQMTLLCDRSTLQICCRIMAFCFWSVVTSRRTIKAEKFDISLMFFFPQIMFFGFQFVTFEEMSLPY